MSHKINVSNSISRLTPMEEVVFLHLVVSCDDYGRFYGNPAILKGNLFPLRDFEVDEIEAAVRKLEAENMVRRYESDGTVYMELTAWFKYQKPRAKVSKYPAPDDAEPYVIEEPEEDEEPEAPEPEDDSPVVYRMKLKTGEHGVTEADIAKYTELYPDADVQQELRNMVGWCDGNPAKRKTKGGVKRFIASWLSKANKESAQRKQETGKRGTYVLNHPVASGKSDNPFRQ